MRPYKEIGQRLKELRGKRTQADFAKQFDIPISSYKRYESGATVPPPHVLATICDKHRTTIDWLLTGDTSMYSPLSDIRVGFAIPHMMYKELEDFYKSKGKEFPFPSEDEFNKWQEEAAAKNLNLVTFPEWWKHFFYMFHAFHRVVNEADKKKMNALEALLRALDPGEKSKEPREPRK